MRRPVSAALALFLATCTAHLELSSAFTRTSHVGRPAAASYVHSTNNNVILHMTVTSSPIAAPSGAIPLSLKKPSKTLTVCVEYDNISDDKPTSTELATLSMQLRKLKCSAVFTSDVDALAEFAKEQETARGDFPGPCPVVYCGDVDGIAAAVGAGASAIVLDVDSLDNTCTAAEMSTTDIIWEVASAEEVEAVLAAQEAADSFLITGKDAKAIIEALPGKNIVAIGTVDAMQDEEAEISEGRALKQAGCASVLIRRAMVGDSEDLDYTRFAIDGLTSKASSEFNFSGLTGSANGHFGGVASAGKNKWKRNLSANMAGCS